MMNTIQTILFYVFAAVLLLASFRVITSRNPVHAAMYLVLAFFQAAAIWLLIQAEFLALTLVLVYVGAVMVLFLFVLMMIPFDAETMRKGFWKHFPLAAAIGLAFVVELGAVFMSNYHKVVQAKPPVGADGQLLPATVGNTQALGQLLYSQYLYPVEIAAVLLLLAIIAAIALTLRSRKDSRYQSPHWQVNVKAADRMRVVKLEPTRAAPAAVPEEAATGQENAS
ncbi:MAG: NADH-quinone oxidoreductase subunit J [Brachymonas sp.]|nr:NADH-quinone oxidoreductase subunit J [Brachymonas sp.]